MVKLEVYNLDREPVCLLNNAFNISEEQNINALWYLDFSIPADDPKVEYCNAYWYVRCNDGELYRMFPAGFDDSDDMPYYTYHCEHVLANLLNKTIPGVLQIGGYYEQTADAIKRLLALQDAEEWVLYECDFSRRFEYGFEKENLLAAIFSIPRCFNEPYIWITDTTVFPWRLSLKYFDETADPVVNIRYGHNRLHYSRQPDYTNHVTKLYAYGSGEGVNQITIKEQTNGLGYILADAEHIAKYGIRESVWVDRRYDNSEVLYGAAQAMLKELQDPIITYECGFIGDIPLGSIVEVIGHEKTYVSKKVKNYSDVDDISYELANKQVSIATTIADLADRQRIETTYSQGATNIYSVAYVDNADSANALECNFYIPIGMRFVNKVVAKIKMESFRAYSGTVSTTAQTSYTSSSGGSYTSTSSSGGGTSTSTDSGGGTSRSTASGGNSSETTTANRSTIVSGAATTNHSGYAGGGESGSTGYALTSYDKYKHYHYYSKPVSHTHTIQHGHEIDVSNHTHNVSIPSHRHSFEIPSHSHSFSIPDHSHSVSIPSHTHTIEIPGHKHDIKAGIFRQGYPKTMQLYVNNALKETYTGDSYEVDITDWLANEDGDIQRGSWQTFSVKPDDLAHISVTITILGFIQSMEGGTY